MKVTDIKTSDYVNDCRISMHENDVARIDEFARVRRGNSAVTFVQYCHGSSTYVRVNFRNALLVHDHANAFHALLSRMRAEYDALTEEEYDHDFEGAFFVAVNRALHAYGFDVVLHDEHNETTYKVADCLVAQGFDVIDDDNEDEDDDDNIVYLEGSYQSKDDAIGDMRIVLLDCVFDAIDKIHIDDDARRRALSYLIKRDDEARKAKYA